MKKTSSSIPFRGWALNASVGLLAPAYLIAGLAMPLTSHATDVDADSDQSRALEEIVVTARRRAENLENVPVAVDVVSASSLAEERITTEQDLEAAVPGLLSVAASFSSQQAFAIRGQALDAFSYTSPPVLTYFDEFQTGGSTSTTFFDLQSIQVLKGPQGTLFGRNATGGAILYSSTQPGNEFGGYLNYTAGNYNEQKIDGAMTLPLIDWASFRVAAEVEHRDGYEHNIYLDIEEASIDNRNVRGTLLLTPTNSLQNTTTVQYGRQGGNSGAIKITSANTTCPPSPQCLGTQLYPTGSMPSGLYPAKLASYNGIVGLIALQAAQPFYNVYSEADYSHDAQLKEAINRTNYSITDNLSIKNIIGYNQVSSRDKNDATGSPFGLLPSGLLAGPAAEGYRVSTEQYSDELQLAGTSDIKQFTYLFGAYYSRNFDAQNVPLNLGCGSPAFAGNPDGCGVPGGFRYNFENDEKSQALFGQLTYSIVENLRATAGYRETWENVDFSYVFDSEPYDVHYLAGVPAPSLSEREPSWTLGLDYQLSPGALIYIAQRGGFRVGGFNGTSTIPTSSGGAAIDSFRPEIARDIEIGAKYSGEIFSLPARVNAAVYEERVTDAQRVVYAGISSQTTNAAKAQVDGFEMDAQLDLASSLELGLQYAYTDARYTDGRANFSRIDVLTNTIVAVPIVLGPYADAPRHAGSLYVRYKHDLPNNLGQLVVRQEFYCQTSFYYSNLADSRPIPLDPDTRIGGYTLANASIDWNNIAGSQFHLIAYVKNMFNKEYAVGGIGLGAVVGVDSVILGQPRMAGVEVGLKF